MLTCRRWLAWGAANLHVVLPPLSNAELSRPFYFLPPGYLRKAHRSLHPASRKDSGRNGTEMRRPHLQQSAPPRDGGWTAWLQVSAAFALYWNSL